VVHRAFSVRTRQVRGTVEAVRLLCNAPRRWL